MEATLKQIMEATGPLNQLMGAKLPAKAAYAVSKLASACTKELEHFGKVRDKMFEEGGCKAETVGKDAQGNDKQEWVHPEGKEKVLAIARKADEMLDSTVTLSVLPLDLEQFNNVELPGSSFYGLDWAMKAAE